MKRILFLAGLFFNIGCGDFKKTPESEPVTTVEETESKYSIAVSGSCSYAGELISDKVYGFTSDNDAQTALNRIMDYTGLPVNFKLMAADVDNACAVIQRKSSGDMVRYIMYNQQFMMSVKDLTNTHWSEVSILAHEIGHHLSGHTLLQGGSRPDIELEADRFSGFILYKMGATLEESQIAMKTLASETASISHPAKKSRLVAITNGWLAAKEQDNSNGTDSQNENTTENTDKTIETVTDNTRDNIISTLNRYYQINSTSRCYELTNFYLPVVDNYFNKSNLTSSEIVVECERYHNRWPYQNINVDNSTFSITQLQNGDYFVTYDMFYSVKREISAPWKDFYLTINVRFTPDLKIRSIYEYQR